MMRQISKPIKIVIAGIGGVGGYFGGKLAKHFENKIDVSIIFYARGANEKAIRENGLKVESGIGNFIAKPKLITSDANEIGIADYLILCTKSYDLEQTLLQLASCIDHSTMILPLLNGIDSNQKIKDIFPENEVAEGCVYIVSRLVKPGLIKQMSDRRLLFFGSKTVSAEKLHQLESIFKSAGIDAKLPDDIQQTIWEKFLFISPLATATSYFDASVGVVLSNPEHRAILLLLLAELKKIAESKQIHLSDNIIEKILEKMDSLPVDITSSMHTDFENKKPTELDSLTGNVVKLGQQLNVATPTYERLYKELRTKIGLPLLS